MKRKIFTIVKEESERVPGKNFRVVGEKPLWRWLVDELGDYELYINTDSAPLLRELEAFKHVRSIERSQKHIEWEKDAASRGSPVMDMVKEFCENYLSANENFGLVHITSPFLKNTSIEKAFVEFEAGDFHSLHSVRKIQDVLFTVGGRRLKPINASFSKVQRTQDLDPIYQSIGAFFIMNSEKLRAAKYARILPSTRLFELSALESLEVDNEDDMALVSLVGEALLESEE